jgi:hypothetical protein
METPTGLETTDNPQLWTSGLQRLLSREYPESVAKDLRKQGLSDADLEPLFRDAARRQRRSGVWRTLAGVIVSLITLFIVLAASEAGIEIYGPGLCIGLFVLANGILKLKNGVEIARVITRSEKGETA